MLLEALIIVATQLLAAPQGRAASIHAPQQIELLCAGKEVHLAKFSELEHLVKLVDRTPCWGYIRNALVDLEAAIKLGQGDLCALSSFEAFRDFYAKYLEMPDSKRKEGEQIGALRRLALAYGLQMSDACKWHMAKVLTKEVRGRLLAERDFELMEKFLDDEGPVARVMAGLAGPDELLLPGDLVTLVKSLQGPSDRLYLQLAAETQAQDLQALCQLRFRPIYEPLMRPLVRLANLGLSYRERTLRSHFKSADAVARVNLWSRIVFLCEALEGVRIVDAQQPTGLSIRKAARILTEEEAVAIEGAGVTAPTELIESDDALVREPVPLKDLVYDPSDKDLLRSMSSFDKTRKTERAKTSFRRTSFSEAPKENAEVWKRLKKLSLDAIVGSLKGARAGLILSDAYQVSMRASRKGQIKSSGERLARRLRKRLGRKITRARDPLDFMLPAHATKPGDLTPLVISLAVAKIII